jgi:hypothetical protein
VSDKSQEKVDEKPPARSTAEIQSEIEETRQRLADNLSQLKAETTPKALFDKAKDSVTGVFVDHGTGEIRVERVAAVVAGVVGLIIIRKGFKARARKRELRRLAEVVWVPVPKSSVSSEFAPVARTAAELAPVGYTP